MSPRAGQPAAIHRNLGTVRTLQFWSVGATWTSRYYYCHCSRRSLKRSALQLPNGDDDDDDFG